MLVNKRLFVLSNSLQQIYKEKSHVFHFNANQESDNTMSNGIANINDYKDFISDFDLCEKLKYKFGIYVPSNYVEMNMSSKEEQLSFL